VSVDDPVGDGNEADAEQEVELWRRWRESSDAVARDELVVRHMPFARVMALKLFRGRYSDEFEFADYLQFANLGMLEALQHYDPTRGAGFRTYSALRIRGSVLDGLTSMSERQQQIETRRRVVRERSESIVAGRASRRDAFADLAEVAIGLALGYMLEGTAMFQQEESVESDGGYLRMELRQMCGQIRGLVEQLPAAERTVVKSHYLNHIAFTEIAVSLGVTKARVSQLHHQALARLRQALGALSPCDMAW